MSSANFITIKPSVVMMVRKLLILSAIVLVFLVGSFWIQEALDQSSQELLKQVAAVMELTAAGDWSGAVLAFQNLFDHWSTLQEWWALVTDHEEIDEISRAMHKVSALLANQDLAAVQAELSALTYLIGHIPQKERLTLTTLF